MSTVFTTVAQTILSTSTSTLISTSIDPYRLFEDGENGTYSDIRTYVTNYFSDAGTTPAEIGDPIYQINDQSGNGANWTQATLADRPTIEQDSVGLYLDFSGGKSLSCTLAAGTYTIILPTRTGIWVNSVTHAGGTFSIGPTTYTGGPTDLLAGEAGYQLIGPPFLRDTALTAAQQSALEQWYRNRGAGAETWEYTLPWILETGAWDDNGYWIDALNWRDAA